MCLPNSERRFPFRFGSGGSESMMRDLLGRPLRNLVCSRYRSLQSAMQLLHARKPSTCGCRGRTSCNRGDERARRCLRTAWRRSHPADGWRAAAAAICRRSSACSRESPQSAIWRSRPTVSHARRAGGRAPSRRTSSPDGEPRHAARRSFSRTCPLRLPATGAVGHRTGHQMFRHRQARFSDHPRHER